MENKNKDEPAYPLSGFEQDPDYGWNECVYFRGLTKREYFAANAPKEALKTIPESVAMCAEILGIPASDYDPAFHYPILLAKCAVRYADALLAELEKGGAE